MISTSKRELQLKAQPSHPHRIRRFGSPKSSKLSSNSRSPSLTSRKNGFSLTKKHSIKFDRMYSEKDLLPKRTLSRQKHSPEETKDTQDSIQSIRMTILRTKSETERCSEFGS